MHTPRLASAACSAAAPSPAALRVQRPRLLRRGRTGKASMELPTGLAVHRQACSYNTYIKKNIHVYIHIIQCMTNTVNMLTLVKSQDCISPRGQRKTVNIYVWGVKVSQKPPLKIDAWTTTSLIRSPFKTVDVCRLPELILNYKHGYRFGVVFLLLGTHPLESPPIMPLTSTKLHLHTHVRPPPMAQSHAKGPTKVSGIRWGRARPA